MEAVRIEELEKVKLKTPILIQGLPGVGLVGKIAVDFMIDELKAKRFARIWSPYFRPITFVENGYFLKPETGELFFKSLESDYIFFTAEYQSSVPWGYYELATELLKYAKKLNVKEVVTLAGFPTRSISEKPRILGVVTHEELKEKYEKAGVIFDHKVPLIVGLAGLVAGVAKHYGMRGICLLGETSLPNLPDHSAAQAMTEILMKVFNFKLDLSKLKEKVAEAEALKRKLKAMSIRLVPLPLTEEIEPEYIG